MAALAATVAMLLQLGFAPQATAAAADPSAMTATELATPAAERSVGPSFATGPDGTIWLSWVEGGRAGRPNALRLARFDPAARAWDAAHAVVADGTVTTNPVDFPQLAVDGRGRTFALWTDGHGGAFFSTSDHAGATWRTPQPWVRDGHEVEKFSLARLADGRVLVAWLDGRARRAGGHVQQLYARILGAPENTDQRIDASVCDCCQTSLTPFLDGGARVAYRGRTADDVRDILTARYRGNAWDEPRLLNADDWRVNACPVKGPRVSSDGSRIAVAWFTAANNEPRVNVSFSPDAGERWLMPLRVDHGHPAGHVDTVLLRDSTLLVTWLEGDGSVWLRRVSPDFAVNGELELAGPHAAATAGVPRMVLRRDYAGGQAGAQVLVAFARGGGGIRSVQVDVPEGQFLESERNCDCLPTPEQLSGFALRGTIVVAAAGHVQVRHAEVPGVFPAGVHDFVTPTPVAALADAGRPFLARIARADGKWILYDVRFLGAPAAPSQP